VKGNPKDLRFATRAIHAGQPPDPATGSVVVPIYQTSTYVHDELGQHKGFEYARVQNPTRTALEENIASLEGGVSGHAFASGMAAITALVTLIGQGDHVVASQSVYGGTYRLFTQVLDRYGLEFSWVDTSQSGAIEGALTERTKIGFGLPLAAWLRNELRPWAEDSLSAESLRRDGLLDPRPVRAAWQAHLAGEDRLAQVWTVLMFLEWRRRRRP